MKKKLLFSVLLCAVMQSAWAQWRGSGTESDPYLIETADDWKRFCTFINEGITSPEDYSSRYYQLVNNITVSENHTSGISKVMAGISTSDATKFSGCFDGDGHAINLKITDKSNDNFCAPFRYLKNGTIKNLHVEGSIVKENPTNKSYTKNIGGLVGRAEGKNTIINCRVSVDIQFDKPIKYSTFDDRDVTSGGFIGELRQGTTTTLTDCLFDGKLHGQNSINWGGFVGWVAEGNTATFNNCLFAPEHIHYFDTDSDDNSKTFARMHKKGKINVTDCYYKTLIKDAQGATDATGMDNKTLLSSLGTGWNIIAGQVLPFTFYTFAGNGDSESSPYLIRSAEDWNHLASNVEKGETYSGKFFQLTTDISVSRMVGIEFTYFKGTFDGGGHTLKFIYEPVDPYIYGVAPFGRVDGANIKNLHVTGEITVENSIAGGLIGYAAGNTTITNCLSSMTIDCVYKGDGTGGFGLDGIVNGRNYGGFIGGISNTKTVFTGCAFDGILKGKIGSAIGYSGGFVGTMSSGAKAEFNDCMSDGIIAIPNLATCRNYIGEGAAEASSFNNCYWAMYMVDDYPQGKEIHRIKAGVGVTVENAGTPTVYDVSRITAYGTGIKYNDGEHGDRLIAGNEESVSLNLHYNKEPASGYTIVFTADNGGAISGDSNPYTLTMPDHEVTVSATIVKTNTLTLIDGADNTDFIQQYDGQTVDVVYDRELSAIDNGDGTWTPRCYTICLPYDFDLYEKVESGQANLYRLKYVDTENSQFIFTNDFGFATAGMGWLLVVNHGTINLNATNAKITAQTKSEEVYAYQSINETEDPQVIGSWTGTFSRIYDDEAEPLNIYGMQSDGNWERSRVTSQGPKCSWIETFRPFFQATEPLGVDTFKPVFTFTGAGDAEETGEIEAFPADSFEGDVFHEDATGIVPTIRTIDPDGTSRYFDLQGRMLNGKPDKGVYIKNGKKFVTD